jgi:hypothetical protein
MVVDVGVRRMHVLQGLPTIVEEIDNRWQGRRRNQAEAAERTGASEQPCVGGGILRIRRFPSALLDRCAIDTAPTYLPSTGARPTAEHSPGRDRLDFDMADEDRQAAWNADTVCRAECPPDPMEQDVYLLVDRIAELERELANAHRYLEACREVIGARDGELLIDAIRRRSREAAQSSSR